MHDISIPYWLIVDTKDFKMYALGSYMHISPNFTKMLYLFTLKGWILFLREVNMYLNGTY